MTRPMLLEELERAKVYVQMVPIVKSYKNLDELHAKIAPYSYRVTKDECLDLAPKIYMTRDVELTDEQRRMYDEMRRTATAELDGQHVVARAVVTKMLRQQQILCGHATDESGRVLRVKSNRIEQLLEVLDEHEGKAIVWSTWRPEIEDIVAAIQREYDSREIVAQFHGGNASTRGDEERRFLSDPACRFMVSSQATGGFGNTWIVADLVVYSSNNHDLELRDQSEDRAHRKGQTRSVTYVDLVAQGTVDEKIISCLRRKIDLAAQINGDNYREWLI
jgi:SNF2 family DNA or RNA helicase